MTRPAVFFSPLFWLAFAGLSMACPDAEMAPMEAHAAKGRELWNPARFAVQAGGDYQLLDCALIGWGHVRQAPDFVFDLTRMRRFRRLHLRSNAACDTVLLLRAPSGRWCFDDDSGVGQTASLSLADPEDGAYAVWVGSFRPEGCDAVLTLETF